MAEDADERTDELRFEVTLDPPGRLIADAVLGKAVFEVLSEVQSASRLQAATMQLARIVAGQAQRTGILVLDRPALTRERLHAEWASAGAILKPEVFTRLKLVITRDEEPPLAAWGEISAAQSAALRRVLSQHHRRRASGGARGPRWAFFDVLRVLLVHWFRRTGPLTSKQLCAQCGVAYPTLAAALAKLKPHLYRSSDRRVELCSFPTDAWLKLTSQADEIRQSHAYTDRSGQPRPLERLLERLYNLAPAGVAVGGVPAARYYLPGLDLVGTPRLDLVVHAEGPTLVPGWLRRLDAGLKPARHGEPARVVVHHLARPTPFFVQEASRLPWADEVECVLDLLSARLLPQASELLEHLKPLQVSLSNQEKLRMPSHE